MSRPTFITWAPNGTSYPAGGNPWSGQLIRVAPGASYATPGTLLPAENYNYILGNFADGLNWLANIQLRNLETYSGAYNGTPHNGAKPVFDSVHGWWLAGAANTSHGAQVSKDYGRSWAIVATDVDTVADVHAIYADSSGWYVVNQSGGGGMRRSKSTDQGATWTAGNLDAAWAPNHFVQDLLYFNSKFIVIGSDGSNTRIYTSDTTYTTWTHITNPAAINTVTTVWRATASSARWMAVAASTGGFYCTTTDGTTFTAAAMSGVLAGWTPKGICYHSGLGLFFAAGDNGVDTKIYSSTDGSAWTLTATITGVLTGDIGASGAGMVVVEASTGQNPKTYFSADGATWSITPIQLSSDTTPFLPVRVLSSDNQMGVANGTSIVLSLALG